VIFYSVGVELTSANYAGFGGYNSGSSAGFEGYNYPSEWNQVSISDRTEE
jgi:hypothetical protein